MVRILMPAVFWALALSSRPVFLRAHCTIAESCNAGAVPFFDRFAIGLEVPGADLISFWGQNLAGIFSLLILLSIPGRRISRALVWLEAVLWNGFVLESIRLLVQRPRPFVYADLASQAANPAHYTSFYSGHTSFAAAAAVITVLLLSNERIAPKIRWIVGGGLGGLVVLTGVCRVLAGRHFPSDVLAAAIAGTGIAYVTYRKRICVTPGLP